MNLTEKKYLLGRIQHIGDTERARIVANNTTPAIKIDNETKLELIRAGKVQLKEKLSLDRRIFLFDAYDFSVYENPEQEDKEAIKTQSAWLATHLDAARDQVMLGDSRSEGITILQKLLDTITAGPPA